jgi:hypothetical protein
MRPLRFGEMECEDPSHDGNTVMGDVEYACEQCDEIAADDAADLAYEYAKERALWDD